MKRIIIFLLICIFTFPVQAEVGTLELLQSKSDGEHFTQRIYNYSGETHLLMAAGGSLRDYRIDNINVETTNFYNDSLYYENNISTIIKDIVISDTYAYIIGVNKIAKYNYSTKILSNVTDNPTSQSNTAGAVSTDGSYLYVSTLGNGVNIYLTSTMNYQSNILSPSNIYSLDVNNLSLYVGGYSDSIIRIYNISVPLSPEFKSNWTAPDSGGIKSIKSVANNLFATTYTNRWYSVNVSNESNPTQAYRSGDVGGTGAVSLYLKNSTTLLLSIRYSSYHEYDVTNISAPILLKSNDTSNAYNEQISYYNGSIFDSSMTIGLTIINETTTVAINTIPISGQPYSLMVFGDYLIFGGRNSWLNSMYISNLTIKNRNRLTPSSRALQIIKSNDTLYVPNNGNGGIRSNRFTSDGSTLLYSNDSKLFDGANAYEGMLKYENYIYTTALTSAYYLLGVYTLDGVDGNATLTTTIPLHSPTDGVNITKTIALWNSTTLLLSNQGGLFWIDISNRTNPNIIKKIEGTFGNMIFNSTTNIAFLWRDTYYFESVNLTGMNYNPIMNISRSGSNAGYNICQLDFNNIYSGGSAGIDQYNVTYPNAMVLVNTFRTYTASAYVACDSTNKEIYAGDGWGIYQLNHSDIAVRPPPQAEMTIEDNFIYKGLPNSNNGGTATVDIYGWADGTQMRGVYGITTNNIPEGSTIVTATLYMTYSGCLYCTGNLSNWTYQAFRVWNNRSTSETGTTYNNYTDLLPWTTSGGDYYSNSFVNFTFPNTTNTEFGINITTLLQEAVDNSTKLNLILKDAAPFVTHDARVMIHSMQQTNETRKPWIYLEYVTQESVTNATTDDFEVYVNGTSIGDHITTEFYNLTSLDPHASKLISIRSHNHSFDTYGAWENITATIPDNPIIITNITEGYNYEYTEGETFTANADYDDADSDIGLFSDNSSEWDIDVNTGAISWVTSGVGNYSYQVLVTNSTYSSSSLVNFTVTVNEAAQADTNTTPSLTSVTNATCLAHSCVVSFDVNQSNALTMVKYGLNESLLQNTTNQSSDLSRSDNLTGLTNNTKYYYSVFAWNSSNASYNTNSTTQNFTTAEDYVPPETPAAPAITSYAPTDLTPTIDVNELASFNTTANQSVTWTWTGATEGAGDGTQNSIATNTWTTTGAKTVTATCSNANGSCGTIQWDVTVVSDGSGGSGINWDWLNMTVSPAGSTVTISPSVSGSPATGGVVNFGYVFVDGNSYWVNVTKTGYTANNTLITFNEDNEVWDVSLTAIPSAVTITTNAATSIRTNGATLNGEVNFSGGGSLTMWFEYGTNGRTYPYKTTTQTTTTNTTFSHGLYKSTIMANTKYYYRAVAYYNNIYYYGE